MRRSPKQSTGGPPARFLAAYARAQTEGKLILSSLDLAAVPAEALAVGHLEIPSVPGYAVVDLTTLDLSHNALAAVPLELLDYDTLLVVNLGHNALDDAGIADAAHGAQLAAADRLPVWPSLLRLTLANNALTAFPFPPWPSLRVLDLAANALRALDGYWPSLVELNLAANALTTFDVHAPALTSLDLSRNSLAALPEDLAAASPALTLLNVASNALTALPPSLADAPALATLDASSNARIASLPAFSARAAALHTLDISHCSFATLPVASLAHAPALAVVRAESCRMRSVPDTVSALAPLVTLDVANNDLKSLPPTLALCPALKHLGVVGNPFRSLRRSIITRGSAAILDYLRTRLPTDLLPPADGGPSASSVSIVAGGDGTLDLSRSSLDTVPLELTDAGAGPPAPVATLSLASNAITALPPALSPPLASTLTSLDVSRNSIAVLPDTLLASGLVLTSLNVSHNALALLPDTLTHLARTLTHLDVSYNPGIILGFPLDDLPLLTHVAAAGCRLEQWPYVDDGIPPHLVELKLDTNKLASIPPIRYIDALALDTLDIRNNDFTSLPLDLGFAPRLSALMFDGNPSRKLLRLSLKGTQALKRHLRVMAGAE